ncbi:MAG: PstS family phosphate ABC transporter substrate-binding protein [Spirochaetales bacterium]|nr:PstS family phosphate ABC transporter substrate-binding protein [Spirochaetales bacterium]
MKRIVFIAICMVLGGTLFAGGTAESTGSGSYAWLMSESDDAVLPGVNPMAVEGNIITAGSSTVFPLSEKMVERFIDEGYGGNITVDCIGSGAGFERWAVAAETDISNASRKIKDKEVAAARENGREPIEFRVGTDALAVVINPKNTFLSDVTMEELALIFSSAKTWAEVNSSWPNEEIKRFIPGTDSGTFDYFVKEVFDKDEYPMLASDNLQMSEDDNILVRGIAENTYAIGFFGYAYYAENKGNLKILNINGIEANDASVDNGTYPLARPLFIYSSAGIMHEKPQVAAFINFYLTYVNEEIREAGYFPAGKADLEAAKKKWMEAMEGKF